MAILEEPITEAMELENFINGEWVKSESQELKDVINPATQKVLAKVPMSTQQEVTAAIEAAQEAFPEWRRTAPLSRVRCLFRLKELLEENFEELSRVQTMEHGKTIDESRGGNPARHRNGRGGNRHPLTDDGPEPGRHRRGHR